jgi:hypothetical protein
VTGGGRVSRPWSECQAACYKGISTYIFGGYAEKDPEKGFGGSVYYGDGVRLTNSADGSLHSIDILPFDGVCPSARAGSTFTTGMS